ncbi:MAG TPA: GNAT family N-acetyltransferase, partial [Candidatus Acidoferrales bacterium]|nr:GNAT family N-acetyltransferase [Candidatus Acidoferrales bacterium]
DSDGNLAGWIQLFDEFGLAGGHRAEVAGLVVDESCRGAGVGRQLMEFAERWAKKRGCRAVYLRSNVTRAAAHIFYERMGYEHIKTQKAYRKIL